MKRNKKKHWIDVFVVQWKWLPTLYSFLFYSGGVWIQGRREGRIMYIFVKSFTRLAVKLMISVMMMYIMLRFFYVVRNGGCAVPDADDDDGNANTTSTIPKKVLFRTSEQDMKKKSNNLFFINILKHDMLKFVRLNRRNIYRKVE